MVLALLGGKAPSSWLYKPVRPIIVVFWLGVWQTLLGLEALIQGR